MYVNDQGGQRAAHATSSTDAQASQGQKLSPGELYTHTAPNLRDARTHVAADYGEYFRICFWHFALVGDQQAAAWVYTRHAAWLMYGV